MSNTKEEARVHDIVSEDNDTLDFYLHFLKKSAKGTSVIVDKPDDAETNSLLVIDMQDDFVLQAPEGRFSVADGVKMAPKLARFIKSCLENPTFTKVIFSRDTHDINHCSFQANEGPFPTHCVANHQGAQMHASMITDEMKDAYKRYPKKVDVIFKGCDQHTDSFGAMEYPNDEYATTRQIGKNCKYVEENTGGKYLKDQYKHRKFLDEPFSPKIPKCNDKNPTATNCPESTGANIKEYLGQNFKLSDLLPRNNNAPHNIYITGLAGDFCVKDTAINIMKAVKAMKENENIRVYILQPFVRSAFLPFGGVDKGENTGFKNFFNTSVEKGKKDITKYIFGITDDNKLKVLTKDQVNSLKNGEKNNIKLHLNFITSTDTIIDDYRENNVKILLDVPAFDLKHKPEWRGGGRTRSRKYRNKKTHKRK
jgi:nicotinamidase-related amidase